MNVNSWIKTGKEIHQQGFSDYGAGEHQRIQKDMTAKWVSVDWLKAEIENELNLNKVSGIDDSKLIILGWVLGLLEG